MNNITLSQKNVYFCKILCPRELSLFGKCVSMCKLLKILGVLFVIPMCSWGQEDITITWKNDTCWYVNPSYDEVYHPNYHPTFTFPKLEDTEYLSYKIVWGDGIVSGGYTTGAENQLDYLYTQPGIFDLEIQLYKGTDVTGAPDTVYHKKIMNRNLEAAFHLSPAKPWRCMEWGGDSVKLIVTGHDNPPGTKYEIVVNSDIEKFEPSGKPLFHSAWIDDRADSAWIVALKPTGTYGARVGLNLVWQQNGVVLNTTPVKWEMFYAFKTPNLRDIYHFTDSLKDAEVPDNFKICTSNETGVLWLDTAILAQYQYRFISNPQVTPQYNSVNNKLFFDIQYFYTDELPADDTAWEIVTADARYVDTTRTIKFKKAGFYKMKIEAYNQCGFDPKDGSNLLFVDSLWTDSLKNDPEKRYFQVFEQGKDQLVCRQDSVCTGGVAGTVTFVDRNMRMSYDAPPTYELTVKKITSEGETDVLYSMTKKIYKGGIVLTGNIENAGCDSTEIILTLSDTGNYAVNIKRSNEVCDPITQDFNVFVGDVPVTNKSQIEDKLFLDYFFEYNAEGAFYQRCDTFQYTLQKDIWTVNNYAADSIFFYFEKNNGRKDTVLNYAKSVYSFDTVGNTWNFIRTRAHNFCGWGNEVTVQFYTRTRPDVKLLRDSLPANDSLCLKFEYDYYLGGVLPENYSLSYTSSSPAYVNGTYSAAGDKTDFEDFSDVQKKLSLNHQAAKKVWEDLVVLNKDMKSCYQEYKDSVYIINAPDSMVFRDSVRYCEGLNKLSTEQLFDPAEKQFRYAEWAWNTVEKSREQFPEFNYTSGVDTLVYKLSNSKGCYIGGELVFRSKAAPKLELEPVYTACLPDTIQDVRYNSYVKQFNGNPETVLSIYHTTLSDATLYCRGGSCEKLPLTSFVSDALRLIYVLENESVDRSFGSGCRLEDTVDITLFRPELKITKKDTLHYDWTSYDFQSMRGYIDTTNILGNTLRWKQEKATGTLVPDGIDRLYGGNYATSLNDRKGDELRFVLFGKTPCGKELCDTLVVVVSHGELNGYADTICSTEEYPLWTKVSSTFIDESSLKWKICYPDDPAKQGHLSSDVGNQVKYTPYSGAGSSDSVRIYVEGTFAEAAGYQVGDTIVLKVNSAPSLTVVSDTLIADHREVNLGKISEDWFKAENTVNRTIAAVMDYNNGALVEDTIYRFDAQVPADGANRYAKVIVFLDGLPGCPQSRQSFTFLDLTAADFSFKRPLEMCAEDEIALDTIYNRLKSFDRYTTGRWTLEGDTPQGTFDSDSSHYTAPDSYGDRTMKLEISKSYKTYNGNVYSGVFPVSHEVKLIVHPEPVLTLSHRADTLCRMQDRLDISRSWLTVSPDLYRDSLLLNGLPFKADMEYLTPVQAGERDSVWFTVTQGRCTKWREQVQDTLFLYRLRNMVTGDFKIGPVCEAEGAVLDITAPLYAPEAKGIRWTALGGTLSSDFPPKFSPVLNGTGEGAVTLFVNAPHGCGEDSLRRDFTTYRMPDVVLQADTVCRMPGQSVTVGVTPTTVGYVSGIRNVEWYRKGETVLLGTTLGTVAFNYTVSQQDSVSGEIDLVAKVWAETPCDSRFVYDTVKVYLQNKPEIRLRSGVAPVCQGNLIDLSGQVEIEGASVVQWVKLPTTAGTLNGTEYNPGEYWGNAEFKVTAGGKHGCPQATEDITVSVGYAPVPQGQILTAPLCQSDTVHLKAITLPGMSVVYEWNFGDNTPRKQGDEVKHAYAGDGTFQVALTGKYGQCERLSMWPVTVNDKPSARFTPDPQVSLGESVKFVSESVPSDVACKWYFDNGTGSGNPYFHSFTGVSGTRKVLLEVMTGQGCRDTVSHTILVVEKPVADFMLKVNSCLGTVEIENHSTRNFADVLWDFGNGTVSSDWEPPMQHYARIFKDTVYQVKLRLENSAGVDSLVLPVKMISKLKAGFEVLPASGNCNNLEKELHVQVQGQADRVKVWWGDGAYEEWDATVEVGLRKHRYANDTTIVKYFPVVLAAENSCERDTTLPVAVPVYPQTVKAKVVLDDSYRDECYGAERGFENKSFGFTSAGYRCEWVFERDGNIVTDNRSQVTHVFEKPGLYQVKLKVYDNCNEDIDSVSVRVHGNDSLDFEIEKGIYCSGREIKMSFVQRGDMPFGDFRWEFSDGGVKSGKEVAVAFPGAGAKTVKLTATADGCKSVTPSRSIAVEKSPEPLVVKPQVLSGCQPFEVEFEGKNGTGEDAQIMWDFKDNAFSDQQKVTKVYETAGTYQVVFRLTTAAGCSDSVFIPVQVLPAPRADMKIRKDLFCTETGSFEVSCLNISPEKENSAFEWRQGNEVLSVQSDSVRVSVNREFGDIEITLKAVHKLSGCIAEKKDTIVSAHQVKAALSLDLQNICEGAPVQFTDHSSYGDEAELHFGDGTVTDNANIAYTYEREGDYLVKLKVSNRQGCADSLERTVTVHPVPEVNFSWANDHSITGLPDGLNVPEKANGGIKFTNLSYLPGSDDTLRFRWSFGDGTDPVVEKSPRHLYPNNGSYKVTLYAGSKVGCRDSVSDVVFISAVKGLYIPTAFAPAVSDEGVNRFLPKGIGLYEYKIRVYDNWGTCVWASDKLVDGQPAEWWDGTFNGTPMQGGLYKWKVTALFKDGTVWEDGGNSGWVLLIR